MHELLPLVNTWLSLIPSERLNSLQREVIQECWLSLLKGMNAGDSCLNLNSYCAEHGHDDDELQQLLSQTGLVASIENNTNLIPAQPFCCCKLKHGHYLYLTRYYYYEVELIRLIASLNQPQPAADFSALNTILAQLAATRDNFDFPNSDQHASISASLQRRFSIITGGPGTGKTTSVALLLWALLQLYGARLAIKVCAPTGKAAKRVQASLQDNLLHIHNQLHLDTSQLSQLLANSESFATIHSLLGTLHHSIYFKANQQQPLAAEVLIVDESSMVGLPLFYKLLAAIDWQRIKHVILLGDPNQLSSVEEGYVFATLVAQPQAKYLSQLTISKRNQGGVAKLAHAILNADSVSIRQLLQSEAQLKLQPAELKSILSARLIGEDGLIAFIESCQQLTASQDYQQLITRFNQSALLTVTNVGSLGVVNLNRQLEAGLRLHFALTNEWYSGRAIMIQANDHNLGLFNGDVGICLIDGGLPRIYFADGRSFIPQLLPPYSLAFALTIHKAQGSEYQAVKVVIPTAGYAQELISRELIYTAITRAKLRLELFCTLEQLHNLKPTLRNSGLGALLTE